MIKFISVLQFFAASLFLNSSLHQEVNPNVSCETIDLAIEGVWQFEVFGTQSMYQEGLLFIEKENEKYTVDLKFDNGILSGYDVQVRDNQLNFNANISGVERISFVLLFHDGKLEGESYSLNNRSQVKGARKVPVD
ncbi:MAG: hypothetical protein WBB24_07590 [Maribacter sp.]